MKRGAKTRPKQRLYIALEQLDFSWYQDQVELVIELWNKGVHIKQISEELGRDSDEVFLLLMDLIRRKRIKERKNGIYGQGRMKE